MKKIDPLKVWLLRIPGEEKGGKPSQTPPVHINDRW
jgi:hypothetical protein